MWQRQAVIMNFDKNEYSAALEKKAVSPTALENWKLASKKKKVVFP